MLMMLLLDLIEVPCEVFSPSANHNDAKIGAEGLSMLMMLLLDLIEVPCEVLNPSAEAKWCTNRCRRAAHVDDAVVGLDRSALQRY